jgi:glycosyl hydrolase family 106( putative alpha-L-rhamnosidase)
MLQLHRVNAALVLAAIAIGLALVVPPAAQPAEHRSLLDARAFQDPDAEHRPLLYWWWPGGAVDDAELRREVAEMGAAGFGGATMTWLGLGVPNPDDPSVSSWGTPEWRAHIATALGAARDQGMRLDFTSATSWPFNSPATTPENGLSSNELAYASREIAGPATLDVDPPQPTDNGGASLVAVTAARPVGPPGAPKPRLVAADSVVDLTERVGRDGRLRWSVPNGDWIVFGLWRRPTGQQPTFGEAAPGATYAIDHFERRAVEAATRYFDEHVLAAPVAPLVRAGAGAVYLDSLEVEAQGLLWTRDLLHEFERRRGYSLVPYLPVLFITGQHDYFAPGTANDPPDYDLTGGLGERARRDYYRTLTDLYIDDQLEPMKAWARSRGLSLRAQPAYGTTLEPIRSAAAVPELETETLAHRQPAPTGSPTAAYGLDAYRMTASGAHIGAANEIGIELGAVFNSDYTVTLADLKSMVDQAYAGGVNQAVLHGYPYRTAPGSTWPSWHPFSSELLPFGFSENWSGVQPQWRHMRGLADYIARNDVALQSGKPRVDLAVYHDGFLVADVASPDPPPVFDGARLEGAGFTYGFVDPVSLSERSDALGARSLFPHGPSYRALIVDREDAMPAAAARRILSLARRRLPIVIVGNPPQRGTSLRDAAAEDGEVTTAFRAILREPTVRQVASVSGVLDALRALGVEPRLLLRQPAAVHSAQRRGDGISVFYLWNPGPLSVELDASFEARGEPAILDAWSGEIRDVTRYRHHGDRTDVPLSLGAGETLLVGFADDWRASHATTGNVDSHALPAPIQLDRWHLRVDGSVPEGTDVHELDLEHLQDWRELPEIRDSSGIGTYRTTVELASGWRRAAGIQLDLGVVHGSVQVRINGVRISDRVVGGAPFAVPNRLLRDGRATVEVEVATPLRNRLLALAHTGDPRYARFLAREAAGSGSTAAGLIGPVRLVASSQPR